MIDVYKRQEQLQGNEEELEPKTGKPGKPIVSEPQNAGLELPSTWTTSQSHLGGDSVSRQDHALRESSVKPVGTPLSTVQPTSTKREPSGALHALEVGSKPKMVPVYKWGLKYDGEGSQSIAAFLERAEELGKARGVSCQELYESAVDLFSEIALIWYRSACRRIFTWEELKEELKVVFQSADYDDRLQLEILHRTQGEMESLDLYLAAMDGLFGRLSKPVPEETKLQRILKNVNTFLQDKLCMFNITTLEELRRLGRRAEVGRLRSSTFQPPPRPTGVLEPELACSSNRRRPAQGNVAYLNTTRDSSSSTYRASRPLKCWNCGEGNHTHRNCKREKKTFCFGCGEAGVKKTACAKCLSKKLVEVEPSLDNSGVLP